MVVQKTEFDSAAELLCGPVYDLLRLVPDSVKPCVAEIRLRVGKPLVLTVNNAPVWLNGDGLHYLPPKRPYIITKEQLAQYFMQLCENSVYSHENEIKQGYIALRHGHRAGVCGTATSGGMIRDISSINIRIARQVLGCACSVVKEYDGGGILIAGPPASGKTTLLRDFIRQLSVHRFLRVAVVDTRGELAASCGGIPANDLGDTVDVLNGYQKAEGIEIAIRTLNPQIVAFDELGSGEVVAVSNAFNSGVAVITTLHAGNKRELFCNSKVKALLSTGAISKILLMPQNIGEQITVIKEW